MFSNIGGKIKGVMILQFVLGLLMFIIAGVAIGSLIGDAGGVIVAVIVIGIGVLINWLNCIIVYGYGQMIENTDVIKDQIDRIAAHKKTEIKPSVSAPVPHAIITADGWVCPICRTKNKTGDFCIYCGYRKF